MRTIVAALLLLFIGGCSRSDGLPQVERIEMRQAGAWSSVDVKVNSRGEGHYEAQVFGPSPRRGSFSLTTEQFRGLIERLRPFQEKAVPLTDKSVTGMLQEECPKGVPSVTDAGGFWIRWSGPTADQHTPPTSSAIMPAIGRETRS